MKHYFIFLFLALITCHSYGQEISIVVYKDIVTFKDKKTLLHKTKYSIEPGAVITYAPNSEFVIFSKNKLFRKDNKLGSTIDYGTIIKSLVANVSKSFFKLMETYHEINEIESDAKGSVIGAAKGLNDKKEGNAAEEEDPFSPIDSAKTAAASLDLKWKLNSSVMNGRLMVIHQQTQDTIYNQPATGVGKATINIEKTGDYEWFIYSKTDKKKRINQTFTKLSSDEYKTLQSEFEAFKKDIQGFDGALNAILTKEYKLKNGIIE